MFSQTKNQETTSNLVCQDAYLSIWIEAFLIDRKAQNLSNGTLTFYKMKLGLFTCFCETQVITKIDQITSDTIRRYLLWLDEKKHNSGGIHACYRALKSFLLWWEDEYELDNWANPIRKVKPPKVPIEPLEGIQTDNFQKLFDACEKHSFYGERDRAILFILLDTGIRASELIDLNLDDLNPISGSLLIRQGKGRKPRTVFVGKRSRKQVRSFLKKCGTSTGALFTTQTGDRLTYWGLREIVRRLSKRAKINVPGLHDFRRSFALNLWKAGTDLETIARLMGHTSLHVLWLYLKPTNQDLNAAYVSPVDSLYRQI